MAHIKRARNRGRQREPLPVAEVEEGAADAAETYIQAHGLDRLPPSEWPSHHVAAIMRLDHEKATPPA